MKRIMFATSVAAVVLILAPSWASPKPRANDFLNNFSGTWQMDAKRSVSAQLGEPFVPVTLIINQTPTQVSIETRRSGQSETLTYELDGSESKQAAQANGPVSWSASWDGEKLVTDTVRNINGAPVVITETRTLDTKGKEMTLYRTLAVQHGYETGQATSTGKDVFIKVL